MIPCIHDTHRAHTHNTDHGSEADRYRAPELGPPGARRLSQQPPLTRSESALAHDMLPGLLREMLAPRTRLADAPATDAAVGSWWLYRDDAALHPACDPIVELAIEMDLLHDDSPPHRSPVYRLSLAGLIAARSGQLPQLPADAHPAVHTDPSPTRRAATDDPPLGPKVMARRERERMKKIQKRTRANSVRATKEAAA